MIGRLMRRVLIVLLLTLLPLAASIDTASAKLPARVATPYTLMDDETRLQLQGGVETPVRRNGPWTGRTSSVRTCYGYVIDARRHHSFGGHDIDAQFEFKY